MALTEREEVRDLRMRLAQYAIPEQDWGGLVRYLESGIPTGSFLRAVLENDLKEAVSRADDDNHDKLADLVVALYNGLPMVSWGSPARVKAWIERGGLNGHE